MKIETLWKALRETSVSVQRRVDPDHKLDLYACFEPPDSPGLLLICQNRPPDFESLRAIEIDRRQRPDGRWTLVILLREPRLFGVFSELCRDIIETTNVDLQPASAANVVLSRVARWRELLMSMPSQLDSTAIRGLIGELLVLTLRLIPQIGPDDAVSAWIGPLGMAQDFRLPSGHRVEVKSVDKNATSVQISNLAQLDGESDSLQLSVVRLEDTGRDAVDAITAPLLIDRVRTQLAEFPKALNSFNSVLRFTGWSEDDPGDIIVRLVRIEDFEVTLAFPRLTPLTVPLGVIDASYRISLPQIEVNP